MSNVESGPLANYNSLTDPHLAAYFANARKQKHLRRAGLITRRGYIVPDRQFKMNLTRREHRAQIHAMIAQAIVQKTLDVERTRQAEVVKKMDEIARLEMMQRIAEDRERKKNGYLPMLGPGSNERGWASRPTYKRSDSSTRSRSAEGRAMSATSAPDRDDRWNRSADDSSFTQSARNKNKNRRTQSAKYPRDIDDIHLATLNQETLSRYLEVRNRYAKPTYSPYCEVPHVLLNMMPHLPAPPKRRKNPRSRASSAKNQDKTEDSWSPSKKAEPCKVTLVYHGPKIKLDSELIDPADDILIEQQMNGGNSVVVFRGRILPGEAFEFTSLRRLEFSFGLTLYINGLRDCLLSSCCEMKHRMGERLGKNGHFSILRVTDAKQCLRCMHSPVRNARKRRTKRRTPAVAVTSEEDKEFQDYEEDFDEANQTQSRGHSSDSDGGLSRSVDSRASGSARKSQGQRTQSRASRSGSRQRSARSNRSQKSDRSQKIDQKSRSGSRDNNTESRQSNKENRARSGSDRESRASSRRSIISRDELDSARKSNRDEHSVTAGLNGATLNGLTLLSGKESRAESSADGKRSPSPRSETRESGRVTALASRNSNKIAESRNSERVESRNSARSEKSGRSESKNSARSESKNSARSESKKSARSESKNSARSGSRNSGKTSPDQRNGSRESERENESRASGKIAGHHDTGSIKSGRGSPSESRKSGQSSPRERNESRTSDRSSVRSESKQNERIGSASHSASRNSGRETNLSHTSEGRGTTGQHVGSRASGRVSADGKKGLEMYEARSESSAHNLVRGSRTPSAGSVRSHASQASERSEGGKLSRPASQASRTSVGSKASQKSKKSNSSGRSSAASKKSHSTLRGDEEHKLHNIRENGDEISLHSNKSTSDNLSKIKRDSVTGSVGKEKRGSVVNGSSGVNGRAQSRNEKRNSNRSSSPDSSSEEDEGRKSPVKQETRSGSGNKGGAGSVVREGTFDNTPTPSVKGKTVTGIKKEAADSSPDSESSDDINDDDDDDDNSDDSKKSPKTGSAPHQTKAGETHGKVD